MLMRQKVNNLNNDIADIRLAQEAQVYYKRLYEEVGLISMIIKN